MEFVFKPEKLTENLFYEISESIAKRTEIFSRKKFPGLWEKTDMVIGNPEEFGLFIEDKTKKKTYLCN